MLVADTTDFGNFDARLGAQAPALERALRALYGDRADYTAWRDRIVATARAGFAARPAALRALDDARSGTGADWFQRETMVGYMCYPDRFAGDFEGLQTKIPYLQGLGVTYLHLLSVLKARPGDSDGGFAVADYLDTNRHLGTMQDLEQLTEAFRGAGISLCLDLVFNHTAREHAWARRAMAGEAEYQDYYFMFPDREVPDRYEQTLDQVFPATAPGNFTWVPECEKWVWTTFYPFQWDLNYRNPAVFVAMLETLFSLGNRGVEVFRFDATIYAWKELGTRCKNLPQTHALMQAFRALAAIVMPGVALKAEAVAGARHIAGYFGAGDSAGRECQLAYNTAAMVALWDCLATGSAEAATAMFQDLPDRPKGTAWVNYSRCHDDIGWATLKDREAASWGADDDHLAFLTRFYAGTEPDSFARGQAFQPVAGAPFAATNGTLASLAGLEAALGQGDAAAVDAAVARILLLQGTVMAIDGIPLLYMGDEIALLNDYGHADVPGCADGRWLHRPMMGWSVDQLAPGHAAARQRIFGGTKAMVRARKSLPALHAANGIDYLAAPAPSVLVFRRHGDKPVLVLANFGTTPVTVDTAYLDRHLGPGRLVDHFPALGAIAADLHQLAPYQVRWLSRT